MARRKSSEQKTKEDPRQQGVDWKFVELVLGSAAIRTIYLWGPPGIGKTYAAYFKGRVQHGLYSITLTEDTPAAELRGQWMPVGGEFVWRDGPFTQAMREGARLVINEISHGSEDVLALLYPVLESEETAKLTLPNNETIRPAPGFNVVVTDNEPPSSLSSALQDRFNSVLQVTRPHPEAIEKLSKPLQHAALHTCGLGPERAISLRSWFMLDELQEELGFETACTAVFGPERAGQVRDAIKLAGARQRKSA